ncbi:MAG: hypothetical protein UY94_C0041G0006 [Parcubacteria group bacterium GW2011_GWA2_56_21]|nr:MAG: hypothetical protein UY94_C0041G0006 [Parcubacteria group bacterium GW2011_GWA2_56_21]
MLEFPADVMVIEAVLVPVVVYTFAALVPGPESPSVPLHKYVYEAAPAPPVTLTTLQLKGSPMYPEEGATEHVADRAGRAPTVTVKLLLVTVSPVELLFACME